MNMATLQTWRKAYGALKDSTKVGLAHVNSDYAVFLDCLFVFFFFFKFYSRFLFFYLFILILFRSAFDPICEFCYYLILYLGFGCGNSQSY